MAPTYEENQKYFAGKKAPKAPSAKVVDAARQKSLEGLKAAMPTNSEMKFPKEAKTGSREGLTEGARSLPVQSQQERMQAAVTRRNADRTLGKADLPNGLRQTQEPILRAKVSRAELNESEGNRIAGLSNRANRVSGPSLPPPFKQHRHVEEVLMLARKAAKSTYTDASELAGVRGVLNHAASNLEDAGQHHARGDYGAAHSSLIVAAHSLDHAVGRIDNAHGGNAPWGTAVHPSTLLKNHLNSYRDEYL